MSWKQTFATIEDERIRNHLRNTEITMKTKDCSQLTNELKKAREEKIKMLHEYWMAGNFPTNTKFPQRRLPHIKDEFGVPCAMAYIIEQSGDKKLVKELEKINNVYIKDVNEGPLIDWINKSGITKEEACQIQPNYAFFDCPPGKKKVGMGNITGPGTQQPGCYDPDERIPQWGDPDYNKKSRLPTNPDGTPAIRYGLDNEFFDERICNLETFKNTERCKKYIKPPQAPIDIIFQPLQQTRQQKLAQRITERREARYEAIRNRIEARKEARRRML